MPEQTLLFILSSLGLLTLSRLRLVAWRWQRVKAGGGLWPILKGGARIDATLAQMLARLPLLLSPWLSQYELPTMYIHAWLLLLWVFLVLFSASTPQLFIE